MPVLVELDLQNVISSIDVPTEAQLTEWVALSLSKAGFKQSNAELTIRVVSSQEIQMLNHQYRGKDSPTNVLSFPFEVPAEVDCDLLGDIIICEDIVKFEANNQNKKLLEHWAHLVVHGTLHLLGFDHIEESEAQEMESLEISILDVLKISSPY